MMQAAFINPIPLTRSTYSILPPHKSSLQPRPHLHHCPVCSLSFPPSSGRTLRLFLASVAAAAALTVHPGIFNPNTDNVAIAARGGGASFASGDVNKDGESLLRWALPINNGEIRELQGEVEGLTADLRGSKWKRIADDVRKAKGIAERKGNSILSSAKAQDREQAESLMQQIKDGIAQLNDVVVEKNADKVVDCQKQVLRSIGQLEEMIVDRFPFQVPAEYGHLPWLRGRATVEMVVEKAGGAQFDIDGTIYNKGKMTMIIDGYSAPITAGNFVQLVNRGFYNGKDIIRSDGFVVQTGKPEGKLEGYIDPNSKEVRTIPLEVFAKGDKEPTYGVSLEDDGRGAAATVLPFSSYGTLAFAREEFAADSGSSQFFWFLFEPDLTPAGRNLLDGRYAVFGYTVDGQKFLKGLEQGDHIVEARVTSGLENLVEP